MPTVNKVIIFTKNIYLPIFIFGQYQDPFQALKGKFKKSDIEEFLASANSDFVHYQLLSIILERMGKKPEPEKTEIKPVQDVTSDDPYGEYGYGTEEPVVVTTTKTNTTILDLLCQAFGIVS